MFTIPILITLYAGFTHAFEADHLLAVSNIVSERNNVRHSLKDGAWWGLGHASTILLIGSIVLIFKASITNNLFVYFEIAVGITLILLSLFRLYRLWFSSKKMITASLITDDNNKHQHKHSLAYGVGLIHGLAGSGALILVVLSQIKVATQGIFYLTLFGVGAIAGMCLAAGLFSIPFSQKIIKRKNLQRQLIIVSSMLCMLYGGYVVYKNLGIV